VARGYNSSGDVLTTTADGTDLNRLWRDLQDVLKGYNDQRGSLVSLLSFKTINPADLVLQSFTGGDFEDASEYGQPVGIRPTVDGSLVGYPFKWRDLAGRMTWQFLADATREQVDAITNAAVEADGKQCFLHVMSALFDPTPRTTKEGNTAFPLWNADGNVPPAHADDTFTGSHTHYVTTSNASLTQVSVDALMELPREHGYGEDGSRGQLLLLVNRQQANVIRGFRSTAAGGNGSYDFIPGEGAPPRLTSEAVVGSTPPAKIGNQTLIGAYGPAWVAENSLIPKGYVLCVVSDGDNSQFNPVGFREHASTDLRGLRTIKGPVPSYPLVDSFWVRGFGTGVRHRGAAAVLQVTASATYTAPSQFLGVR
jgi:hypothetical protein